MNETMVNTEANVADVQSMSDEELDEVIGALTAYTEELIRIESDHGAEVNAAIEKGIAELKELDADLDQLELDTRMGIEESRAESIRTALLNS